MFLRCFICFKRQSNSSYHKESCICMDTPPPQESGRGCPLSPILCSMLISPIIAHLRSLNHDIRSLLYADDLLIILPFPQHLCVKLIHGVLHELVLFTRITGLRVNFNKSAILLKGTWSLHHKSLINSLPIAIKPSAKYLGVPEDYIQSQASQDSQLTVSGSENRLIPRPTKRRHFNTPSRVPSSPASVEIHSQGTTMYSPSMPARSKRQPVYSPRQPASPLAPDTPNFWHCSICDTDCPGHSPPESPTTPDSGCFEM